MRPKITLCMRHATMPPTSTTGRLASAAVTLNKLFSQRQFSKVKLTQFQAGKVPDLCGTQILVLLSGDWPALRVGQAYVYVCVSVCKRAHGIIPNMPCRIFTNATTKTLRCLIVLRSGARAPKESVTARILEKIHIHTYAPF